MFGPLQLDSWKYINLSPNDNIFENGVKNKFSVLVKNVAFIDILEFFRKMLNFAEFWCPNKLTLTNSWGINGYKLSKSFVWLPFLW